MDATSVVPREAAMSEAKSTKAVHTPGPRQDDLCTCKHMRATHFEEPPNACSDGSCLCEQFEKADPLIAAAPELAAFAAKVVHYSHCSVTGSDCIDSMSELGREGEALFKKAGLL